MSEDVVGGGVFEGIRQVARPPYLLGIAVFMLLFTITSTFLFHWPSVLPHGGISRGVKTEPPSWGRTWIHCNRPMRSEGWTNGSSRPATMGISPGGERLDSPVLALYEIRDGKLARAQMVYFDPAAVLEFLATAESRAA